MLCNNSFGGFPARLRTVRSPPPRPGLPHRSAVGRPCCDDLRRHDRVLEIDLRGLQPSGTSGDRFRVTLTAAPGTHRAASTAKQATSPYTRGSPGGLSIRNPTIHRCTPVFPVMGFSKPLHRSSARHGFPWFIRHLRLPVCGRMQLSRPVRGNGRLGSSEHLRRHQATDEKLIPARRRPDDAQRSTCQRG